MLRSNSNAGAAGRAARTFPRRISAAGRLNEGDAKGILREGAAKVLFENLEAGMSIEEVIEQFPVTREQMNSLMAFVARSLEKTPSYG